jgi:proline dehydrogenase
MNGYQCYLKRVGKVLEMEVQASKKFNYNLGLKMIRGAYMNEERKLAAENGSESPVWDTLEETHTCYNEAMQHVIINMKHEDMLFVASHNVETVDIASELAESYGLKDNKRIRFGQLRGFSDTVTGTLAA